MLKKDNSKVAIFYHFIAHYRYAVFRKLSVQEDFQFTIYSDEKSSQSTIKTVSGGSGLRWRHIRNFWLGGIILFQPKAVWNALFGSEGTIIYVGKMWFVSTWVAAILARIRGKKVLMWTIGVLGPENNLQGFVRLCFYRLANGLLLYGYKAHQYLAQSGYPESKMHVIYNSLDYDAQKKVADSITSQICTEIRHDLFKNPNLPILLTIGRMNPRVNYPLLLDAARRLHDERFPVNILIVGDGPERQAVKKLVEQYRLQDNVNLYGACYEEKVLGALISTSDVTVGPGHIGLACIHSLTYGTPVFCHDDPHYEIGPEFEAVRSGVNGGIFKKGDSADLARVVREWLESHPNKEAVEDICKKSIYPNYTPDFQCRKIIHVINKLHK